MASTQSADILSAIKSLMTTLHSQLFEELLISKNTDKEKAPAVSKAALAILPKACNSVGLLSLIDEHSLSFEQVLTLLEQQQAQSVILLEQELVNFNQGQIDLLRKRAKTLIVLDHSESRLSACADIIMPVSAVSEGNGHYVNYQGIAQRFHQVHAPTLPIQESWRWLDSIANNLFITQNSNHSLNKIKRQHHSLADLHQYFSQLNSHWPFALTTNETTSTSGKGIARQTHRASGRTSLMSNVNIHESKTMQSVDDAFNFSMEGLSNSSSDTLSKTLINQPSADMPFTWAPGWNSNQSISQYQNQVGGALLNSGYVQQLIFKDNPLFSEKWPLDDSVNKIATSLVFTQQVLWHQGDWQSNFVAEFTMLFQGNTVAAASEYAHQQGWQQGQYLLLTLVDDTQSVKYDVIAQLQIDEQLPLGLVYGNIYPLLIGSKTLSVTMSQPSEQQITQHQKQQQSRYDKAELAKQNTLGRLQKNDQYIPIRLVSGGLDDV